MRCSGIIGCLVTLMSVGCVGGTPSEPGGPLDEAAPQASIRVPAEASSVSGTVEVQGEASDDVDVASVEVQVDQGAFLPAAGTTGWSYLWDTSGLCNGAHTLTVRATDSSGNVGLAAVSVLVDNAGADHPLGMTLSVAMNDGVIGDTLRVSATFTNKTSSPVQVFRLFLSARLPGGPISEGPALDFEPALGPRTLAPGESVQLAAFLRTSPFDPVGPWQVFPVYDDAENVRHYGPIQAVPLRRQVRLGAATHQARLFSSSEPKYQQTFLAYFDSMTPEYEFKIAQLQPERGRFDFTTADRLMEFAEANGKQLRGHTLIWGNSLPSWLTGRTWTREELIEVLETYVTTVVGHFRGRIPEWDVVNEAIDDTGAWRSNLWMDTIGPEYVALAFKAAHRADPSAKLFYNDFSAERINAKSTAIYNMAVLLKAQGVPIDGIGMQAHVSPNYYPTQAQLEAVIARLEGAGLESELTEVTVNLANVSGLTHEEKLALQAEIYRGMVAACQAHLGCTRVTTWGITDKHTYLSSASIPVLFDTQYEPKPALGVVRSVLGR